MGSPCEIRLHGETPETNERLADRLHAEIVRLEGKYTRFRDDSLTAAINRTAGDPEGIVVDAETAALLDYAETAWRESGGLFDLTAGVLRRCWDFSSGRLPSQAEVAAVLECVGWQHVRWERPHLVLERPGMQLDFGGVVKEYAADRAAEVAMLLGAEGGLVDLGGDIRVIGPQPGGRPWRIGIRDPRAPAQAMASVSLLEGAITTSGDYERFMIVDGVRYSHLLDPRTGWPVRGLCSATVVAPKCVIAGSATTIAMLQGEAGGAWLDELDLPSLRVDEQGKRSGPLASAGDPRERSRRPRPFTPPAPAR
jgi:thiamine biosynthesis lipoprotein